MFVLSSAIKNIRRHMRKSVMYFVVCITATLMLQIYIAGVDRTQGQLRSLPDAMPVSARVASLDGGRIDMLQINEATVDGLMKSHFVRNLQMTTALSAAFMGKLVETVGMSDEEVGATVLYCTAVGIDTIEVLDGATPDSITWLIGYGPDSFQGNDSVCLVAKTVMERNGYSLGDSILIGLLAYQYGIYGEISTADLEFLCTLRIIGVTDASMIPGGIGHVAIPFEITRSAYDNSRVQFTAASASFYVNDPLRLNEFKDEMKDIQLVDVSSVSADDARIMANRGTSLLVNDAAFISAATKLRETLALLQAFFPLVTLAVIAIGYFVAYLTIKSRREEYAIYRLLGVGARSGFCLYFFELAILTLCGSILGAAISMASGIGGLRVGAAVLLVFSASFLCGGVIALLRLGRTNVMLALAQLE